MSAIGRSIASILARTLQGGDFISREQFDKLIRIRDRNALSYDVRLPVLGSLGEALLSVRTDTEIPQQAFAFLCYPSSAAAAYGWNGAGQALDNAQTFGGDWYSPIVRVTESGHTWGVECLETGWSYWIGDLHDPDQDVSDSVSWGRRIANAGVEGWGSDDWVWENQVVAQTILKTNLLAACRVSILGVEYYRWFESGTYVVQAPVAGGARQIITVTGIVGSPVRASFSSNGEKVALLIANYWTIYEANIGQATGGNIAASPIAEPEIVSSAYSDTNDGSTRTKTYDGTHRRPIGVGYQGETLQWMSIAVREECRGSWSYWSTITNWLIPGEDGTDYGADGGFGEFPPGQYIWVKTEEEHGPTGEVNAVNYVYWSIAEWKRDFGAMRERTMWFENNGVAVTEPVVTGRYDRLTDDRGVNGDPRYLGWDAYEPYSAEGGTFDASDWPCSLIDASQCGDILYQPFAPMCAKCSGGEPIEVDKLRHIEEWHYPEIKIPIDGIDAAGGIAVWLSLGKITREYWSNNAAGSTTAFIQKWKETEDTVIRATLSTDEDSPKDAGEVDAVPEAWSEATSLANLESKLEADTNVITSNVNSEYWAVARKLSSGVTVWSVRTAFVGGIPGQYTEIGGNEPAWLPADASLAGYTRRGITEAPCEE